MYMPSHFTNTQESELFELIQQVGVGTLITSGPHGATANEVPLLLDVERRCLWGHLAAPNVQLQDLSEGGEVLLNFLGPSAYVSPGWYESPNMVPTWNFVSVQVRGVATMHRSQDAVQDIVERLSKEHESRFPRPWTIDKLDPQLLTKMLSVIVGFSIAISEIKGKYKLSQNRGAADRAGVIRGLRESGDAASLEMATLMDARETRE